MNKEMLNIYVCVMIFLITIAGCRSDDNQQASVEKMFILVEKAYIDLEGSWRFSIGDDTAWASPGFDDGNWEKIKVPAMWEDQGFHGYNGYAWYRKTFDVPKDLVDEYFILNVGFIDDVDETFVNGKIVGMSGAFPPQFVTSYAAHREYSIPKGLLKAGKNTIAIRVYDAQLGGGITGGVIGFTPVSADSRHISLMDLDIDLSGTWKFSTGDENNWKNSAYDDTTWKQIYVPAHWDIQGYKNYDGFAWYRKTFTLPAEYAEEKMVLMLGKIDDIDQTYVNGTLVGSVGDWNFDDIPKTFNQNNEWEEIRGYYIPDNILIPRKENTIAVRVYDGFVDGGIYQGPIGLITQKKYREYWMQR